uniref:NADH dehydrogenase subunit 6 n=1 Tax=Cichlidogyrus sclerosus TaxID=341068 RepID=A0A3G0X1I6_9PLAT|nr:NADH dehydrogenase subunit 6 [Cichlidogyrus sclerosus]
MLVWVYLVSIISLLLSSNVLFYCVMLVINSLCSISLIWGMSGFGWYSLVMYVVYVGGVYILLLFVSIHNPNSIQGVSLGSMSYWLFIYMLAEIVWGAGIINTNLLDVSFNFCSGMEGFLFFVSLLFFSVSIFF